LVSVCREAVGDPDLVLVGAASAYDDLGLSALADDPAGVGPLGGLRALLLAAKSRGASHALALACDLARLGAPLVRRLATESPEATFLAPREEGLWHTLIARYGVAPALDAVDRALLAREHALQGVVHQLGDGVRELIIDEAERDELR